MSYVREYIPFNIPQEAPEGSIKILSYNTWAFAEGEMGEDGIRDDLVTGVQTCALPIWQVGIELRNVSLSVGDVRGAAEVIRVIEEDVLSICRISWDIAISLDTLVVRTVNDGCPLLA